MAKGATSGSWGYPIAGGLSKARLFIDSDVVVAVGNARARRDAFDFLEREGCRIVSLVHPPATVSRHVTLGRDTVVMPGAVIGPGAHLSIGVIVNTSVSINHDCTVGGYAHISVGSHLAEGVPLVLSTDFLD